MPTEPPHPSPYNQGVQQFGGVSNVGNQAVGSGARAISRDSRVLGSGAQEARGDVQGLLGELRRLLDEHAADLPDAGAARAAADILDEELSQRSPDPGVVGRVLTRLGDLVQPVAPLAGLVAQLAAVLPAVLGG
ncbi:hypothetical protein [Allostreptomyces psammosilenae]|uniref:Multidrug resistance efflux pump n=1 Tax=Allostreptomyces psammosilenae TaxID=1892865 RepID=A0A853AB21_9ACTN|nr:hypothetical protein [Allostreptomyces psammosilenae]NYI07811.1 multidrug resistance efflux pump [Allostreptomyces psammosilenae]